MAIVAIYRVLFAAAMNTQAYQIARTILNGFDKHFAFFQEVTSSARERFERCDWPGLRNLAAERIHLYDSRVGETITKVRHIHAIQSLDVSLWQEVKHAYVEFLQEHFRPELAETFYNSVFCHMFHRKYYNNDNIFVESVADRDRVVQENPPYVSFYPSDRGLETAVQEILSFFYFRIPFEDLARDVRHIVRAFCERSPLRNAPPEELRIDMLDTPFYRNKAAYLIGRVIRGKVCLPFVIPLMNHVQNRLYADTLLVTGDQLGIVFSFARGYFLVKTPVPVATVDFLQSMLPNKPIAEIYMSIGFHKQAKNELYRDFLHHLAESEDPFIIAPGIQGMVMAVFTLVSFPFVFKVIRDRFALPKNTTRQAVKDKYLLVKMHDRVGRMADTLEFSDVAFPRRRFSAELLEELQREAPSLLEVEDEFIVIKHCYIERRMRPLNLFLEQASLEEQRAAISDWGLAIKELMAANIFPGDLLFKNFGVTRAGRIVFYDYDEILDLTECCFRRMPKPVYPEDELAAEPAFDVAPNDVFPEEFLTFLTTGPECRKLLLEMHSELFDYTYWRRCQEDIRRGVYYDVYPYPEEIRFPRACSPLASDLNKRVMASGA